MANLSDLRREVRLHASQCPDTTIDYALIRAMREFCRETWYYQASVYINQVTGTGTYIISPSDGSEVISIEAVDLEVDSKLYPVTQTEASKSDGTVIGFQFEPPSYLIILPVPTTTVTNGIEARLVLMPPENTTTIPDSIYRNFKETIVAGALGFILSMQADSWSNPQLAAMKIQEFHIGMWRAKGDRKRDFRPGAIRVSSRPFLI